jgi:hypothetical protein
MMDLVLATKQPEAGRFLRAGPFAAPPRPPIPMRRSPKSPHDADPVGSDAETHPTRCHGEPT